MQTMLSVNDPSFDLSAIVEVDEASDAMSQNGSDRLEIRFDSTVDMNDDDILRIPGSSTSIWYVEIAQEVIILFAMTNFLISHYLSLPICSKSWSDYENCS